MTAKDAGELIEKWSRTGARIWEFTPDEALIIQQEVTADERNPKGKDPLPDFKARHRALVAKMIAEGEDVPQRVIAAHAGVEDDAEEITKMARKSNSSNKSTKPTDIFGGGRVKPGDVLSRKYQGAVVTVTVGKDSFKSVIERDGKKERPKEHKVLGDVVNTYFPRSEYKHHFSGWGFFRLLPRDIERRNAAAKRSEGKAPAASKSADAKATKPAAKKATKKTATKKASTTKRAATKRTAAKKTRTRKAA